MDLMIRCIAADRTRAQCNVEIHTFDLRPFRLPALVVAEVRPVIDPNVGVAKFAPRVVFAHFQACLFALIALQCFSLCNPCALSKTASTPVESCRSCTVLDSVALCRTEGSGLCLFRLQQLSTS